MPFEMSMLITTLYPSSDNLEVMATKSDINVFTSDKRGEY